MWVLYRPGKTYKVYKNQIFAEKYLHKNSVTYFFKRTLVHIARVLQSWSKDLGYKYSLIYI